MSRLTRKRYRVLAGRLTWTVAALQAAMLLAFWVDASQPPGAFGSLGEALWALAHRPSFYPLAAALIAGPLLSGLAWSIRGDHRRWLAASWIVFVPTAIYFHGPRIAAMLRVLWQRYG